MMNTVKALSKQFFGAKYESVRKSLLAAAILFIAVYAAEFSGYCCAFYSLSDFDLFYRRCHVAGAYRAAAHGNDAGNVYAPL